MEKLTQFCQIRNNGNCLTSTANKACNREMEQDLLLISQPSIVVSVQETQKTSSDSSLEEEIHLQTSLMMKMTFSEEEVSEEALECKDKNQDNHKNMEEDSVLEEDFLTMTTMTFSEEEDLEEVSGAVVCSVKCRWEVEEVEVSNNFHQVHFQVDLGLNRCRPKPTWKMAKL